MELTRSWEHEIPDAVRDRYDLAETRNAAAVLRATNPEAFAEMVSVLSGFTLTLEKLTTPGGNKTVVARELDEAFRVLGWREARFDQSLDTTLQVFRWSGSPSPERGHTVSTSNKYGGHKVDNVKGRAVLDVEWNPKDGNLDRDLANYISLHEGGIIDVGVILTRVGSELRVVVKDLIEQVKAVQVPPERAEAWGRRMRKLADDPLGTATTSNMGKLVPRLERGDGRGCPILAIAITPQCYVPPDVSIEQEVCRLAALVTERQTPVDEAVTEIANHP